MTPSEAVQAYRIKNEFFRDELVAEMCMKIVTHYMKLQQEELELWDSDPEEFSKYLDGLYPRARRLMAQGGKRWRRLEKRSVFLKTIEVKRTKINKTL